MPQQIRLLDRNGNACSVNVEEVISIRPTAEGPEFSTKNDVYFYPTTLEDLLILFKEFGFERLDRTNIVNLRQVQAYDPKARKVYFEHPWTPDSKFATVSEANVRKVEHLAKERPAVYKPSRRSIFSKA